jgi:hypothetical protein
VIFWPVVQQALVALLPTLDGYDDVLVYDGPALSDTASPMWVTVGWSSLGPLGGSRGSGAGDSGSFDGDTDEPVDRMWAERGSVACEFVVWSGDEQALTTHRASAFALVNTLQHSIRLDPTLGVLPPGCATSLSAEVVSAQDSSGAAQRLIVSVNYFVRAGEEP